MKPRFLPKFPIWVQDWLASRRILRMTAEQEGGFLRLCLFQWQDGALEGDDQELLTMARVSGPPEVNRLILDAFPVGPDGLRRCAKVAKVRDEVEAFCDTQAAKGRKANAVRWGEKVSPRGDLPGIPRGSQRGQSGEAPGIPQSPLPSSEFRVPSSNLEDPPTPRAPKRPRAPATGPHHESIQWWESEWLRTRGHAWTTTPKHAALIAKALKMASGDAQEVRQRTTRMLETQDEWIAKNADPGLLVSKWNQLAFEVVSAPRKSKGDQAMDELERIRDADRAARAAGQEPKQLFGGIA